MSVGDPVMTRVSTSPSGISVLRKVRTSLSGIPISGRCLRHRPPYFGVASCVLKRGFEPSRREAVQSFTIEPNANEC
jgi:hypothetical protein